MDSSKAWLFRVLVLAAAGLMLLSWFMPWWSATIVAVQLKNAVVIHPWGLEINLPPAMVPYTAGAELPAYFAPFMWIYLGLCMVGLLGAIIFTRKKITLFKREMSLSKLLVGVVGFSYIICVVVAVIVAAIRVGAFGGYDMPLMGSTFIEVGAGGYSDVDTGLRFGYWLACAVGPLCIVLALLHDKIMGEPKVSA